MLNYIDLKKTRKRWKRRLNPAVNFFYSSRNFLGTHLQSNTVLAYWYQENNFGDQLTPDILQYYGLVPLFTPNFNSCETVSVGSILELVPESYDKVILGSGFLLSTTERKFDAAQILLVRGKLTADKLLLSDSTPLGDPGIIVDTVYEKTIKSVSKKFILGIIPHYTHIGNSLLKKLVESYPNDICIIDVRRKPVEVIADIAACHNIASSSLHGLVVAHSLEIPALLLKLHGNLRGGDFKFKDYYSVYGLEPRFYILNGSESLEELCAEMTPIDHEKLEYIKYSVKSAFEKYVGYKLS